MTLAIGISVFLRNVVMPAAIWCAMIFSGMPHGAIGEVVVAMSIPTAPIAVILAVQYGSAEQEMASALFYSTVLSAITMGGFIWLTSLFN